MARLFRSDIVAIVTTGEITVPFRVYVLIVSRAAGGLK